MPAAAQKKPEVNKNEGEFWVGYAGTIGTSYDIETMVLAGEELARRSRDHIRIKILGGGFPQRKTGRTCARNTLTMWNLWDMLHTI